MIQKTYSLFHSKYNQARQAFGRPLTLAEKILAYHMKEACDENGQALVRQSSYANFYPDRVAMQDATAQMAILQFIQSQRKETAVPTTVHCDHLIQARVGAKSDLIQALHDNEEVYDFLRSASQKYGIGFWKPGSGIIHQVVLENYAFPGGMMLGTDSHTPNAGGLGMLAIGVGGADAVDVMVGEPFSLKWPGVIGVKLTGALKGWSSPKDVILKLMQILTVKGGTGCIVEFFGDGCETISATGKGTIANMGAEHGATTSVFPYDSTMSDYLCASGRKDWAALADGHRQFLTADQEVYEQPAQFFDRIVHIDLSTLEPHVVGPHTPDLARPLSQMRQVAQEEKYPAPKAALIGSCTNSSYEDIGRASSVARAAAEKGLKTKIPFYITPGSESVHQTMLRDGLLSDLEKIGGVVLTNACGPCIGQWHRSDILAGETNTIVSSYNRNFPGRNDGNRATLSFLASPEVVTAMALAGELGFDPTRDSIQTPSGENLKLPTPAAQALPETGLIQDRSGFIAPEKEGSAVEIHIRPDSDRLQLLQPFPKWHGRDFLDMPVLLKAKGKCTTDHISQAGVWLKFRGHLDKISDNTYIGAISAFNGEPTKMFPQIARYHKMQNIDYAVIGDENFGEGSSREHAAMQPRHLGCKVIVAKSFARIHESNLKKHGILPLTFQNKTDYDKILENDRLDVVDLNQLAPGKPVKMVVKHPDGTADAVLCSHTLSADQIKWFKAGSAFNYLATR